jgi:transposase
MFSSHCITMDSTDKQWSIIQPLIADQPRCPDGKGRPWKDPREVMNGILWILRTGAPWYDMPDRYPPYQTCHRRRFQQWVRSGIFEKILQALATNLRERGGIDLSECYIDGGTFIVAKKEGGNEIERKTKRGKGTKKLMAISDSIGLPISVYISSAASPHHEVTALAEATISKCFVSNEKPERLIGEDKAYDSDPLDERLALEYGVEMISTHKAWRKRPKTQDGRPLRSYKHRWKVERLLFAWLQNFLHILVRHDYYSENFLGFVLFGGIMILLMRCL